jgi:NAD(P)-dependent dehydrogenase (short-subunit alcohol dehydrogenase family)
VVTARVALVTGGSDGIGLAIAEALATAGHRVILTARDTDRLAAAASAMATSAPAGVAAVAMDIGHDGSVERALADLAAREPVIDVLVNNAGLVMPRSAYGDGRIAAVREGLEVNLFGTMRLCQRIVPGMMSRGWGRVVNIASTAGMYGPPGLMAYSIAKASVIAFSRSLAVETAGSGVTVNAVSPGPVATPNYVAAKGAEAMARRARSIPSGRLATPGDVAGLVAYLASDAASQVTGQNVALDGGEEAAGPYVAMLPGI